MTTFFVPVYRLEVDYLVRHGQRWSALEHLILWACSEGRTAREISKGTSMPVRLVSECLVNLLRAGWVELRSGEQEYRFASTEAGRTAAAKTLPEQSTEQRRRSALVYMDRLSGQFFSALELTPMRRDAADFDQSAALQARVFDVLPFAPGFVECLPPRKDEVFLRFMSAPRLVAGDLFAPVDLTESGISGLPARSPASVGLAILEAVREERIEQVDFEITPSVEEAALGVPLAERGIAVPISCGTGSLIVGGPEHLAAARETIGAATRVVVIHSGFIGRNHKILQPLIAAAAARDVQVFIHWGQENEPEDPENPEEEKGNASAATASMARTKIPPQHRHNVSLGTVTTGSHAKVILADRGEAGGFRALLGSCNWLASPYKDVEASVSLTSPSGVALIASRLVSVLAPTVGQDPVIERLFDIHQECSTLPEEGATRHTAMIISDGDHHAAVRDAMNDVSEGETVLLGSHRVGRAGGTTVFHPMKTVARHGSKVRLLYSVVQKNLGVDAVEARQAELAKEGVELSRSGVRMHAKFLTWKDRLLITSFNFLSATLDERHRPDAELGVLLTGPDLVEAFEDALERHGVTGE